MIVVILTCIVFVDSCSSSIRIYIILPTRFSLHFGRVSFVLLLGAGKGGGNGGGGGR